MPINLLAWFSVGFFVAGAAIGLALFDAHAKRKRVHLGAAIAHGFFGAVGLILLTIALVGDVRADAWQLGLWGRFAIGVLLAAALGGVALFTYHMKRRPLPIPLGLIHAAAALVGIVLLIIAVVS